MCSQFLQTSQLCPRCSIKYRLTYSGTVRHAVEPSLAFHSVTSSRERCCCWQLLLQYLFVQEWPLIGLFFPQFKQVKQPRLDIYHFRCRAFCRAPTHLLSALHASIIYVYLLKSSLLGKLTVLVGCVFVRVVNVNNFTIGIVVGLIVTLIGHENSKLVSILQGGKG